MPTLRIVDSPSKPTSSRVGGTDARRGRPTWRWLAGVILVVLVIIAIVFLVPRPEAEVSPTQPAPQGAQHDPADLVRPQYSNVIGEVEGVPGLWKGTATVTTGFGDEVEGVPTGWPRTVDGAIAAALTAGSTTMSLAAVHPSTAPAIDERLLSKAVYQEYRSTQETWNRAKAWYHLNEAGAPLNMDDEPSPELRLYWMGYVRYGAYQVTEVTDDLSTIRVGVMMPVVDGVAVGDDLSGVRLRWFKWATTMIWEDGDWRVERMVREEPPVMEDRQSNQPYAKLRTALGSGWSVPADGTDEPYAGVVLAR